VKEERETTSTLFHTGAINATVHYLKTYLSLHEPFHSVPSAQGFRILTSLASPILCCIWARR